MIISIVACFLLGAAPWIIGPYLGWDTTINVLLMIVLGSASTAVFVKINGSKK
jgi:Kef-type K+ transport system membrane component KefB